ncbi:MAG: small multi-drug export protein [Peptococcaceae bacterium]|nr:small multi-drug export protein [Peptococcaceae bacterium]
MAESLAVWFTELFTGYLPKELIVFVISMLPILELRGGLIAAALLDIPLLEAIIICFIGNILPIPFALLLVRPVFNWLRKTRLFRPMVEHLEAKAMGKSDQIQRYEFWGLALFVGIPLPGTGAWTGALIASMLNISIKRAMPPIILGLIMATTIMCLISYGIPALFQ